MYDLSGRFLDRWRPTTTGNPSSTVGEKVGNVKQSGKKSGKLRAGWRKKNIASLPGLRPFSAWKTGASVQFVIVVVNTEKSDEKLFPRRKKFEMKQTAEEMDFCLDLGIRSWPPQR